MHIINSLPPALKKGGRGGGSNLLKLLSLKHLNNLPLKVINLLDYGDNKRAELYSCLSLFLSASLLMEIAAYFAGSVERKYRRKRHEIIRVDLTQGFYHLFLLLPSSLVFISSFIK